MNSLNNKFKKDIPLIDILKSIDLSKITKKEIDYFSNKKILITGVSGLIGINLLFFFDNVIKKKKISMKIDGTFNSSLFSFVKNYFKKNRFINFKKIDLSKIKINGKKKYDLIFHCAGYGQPSKFLKDADSTFKLNSSTIINLKENLKKNGKFIYMSSSEIYSGNTSLCNESDIGNTTPSHPRAPYIESKKFGETYLINDYKNYLIFRACLIYGQGTKLNDDRLLNSLLIRSIKNKFIDIYGGLNQLRSNLYISDAIKMIIKGTVKFDREIFNISNHKMTTIGQMVNIISKFSKKKVRKNKSFIKGSPKIIKISNKKILKSINYKITTNLKDGLIETYKWYSALIN